MKKGVLFFIICFSVLTGFSQSNYSDHGVPVVMGIPDIVLKQDRDDKKNAAVNSKSENLTRFNRKIENLNKKIETAKETKVAKKARAEAIKLMTQTRIIASSELLSATQEVYILADKKYNELVQGDNRAKAIAKSN